MKKLTHVLPAFFALSVFVACVQETGSVANDDDEAGDMPTGATTTGQGGTGGATAGPGVGGSTSMPGGPTIESLTASSDVLIPGEPVTFTATVSDPDGTADIAQGSLTDGQTLIFGPFLKSGGGNTYVAQLSWEDFSALTGIEYPNGGIDVVFQAAFEDLGGHQATTNLQLGVSCDGSGYCGGACSNTSLDPNHCGGCGITCPSICVGGSCGGCHPVTEPILDGCDGICAAQGKTCSYEACGNNGVVGHTFSGGSCSGTTHSTISFCGEPLFDPDVTHIVCCCV